MKTGLPPELSVFFWDVAPEKLNVQRDATFILERLLELGNDDAIRWIRTTYPEEAIKSVVKNSRRLSRKTARFWQVFLGLEEEEVKCLARSYRRPENQLWPY